MIIAELAIEMILPCEQGIIRKIHVSQARKDPQDRREPPDTLRQDHLHALGAKILLQADDHEDQHDHVMVCHQVLDDRDLAALDLVRLGHQDLDLSVREATRQQVHRLAAILRQEMLLSLRGLRVRHELNSTLSRSLNALVIRGQ